MSTSIFQCRVYRYRYIGENREAFLPRGVGVHRPNHTGIFMGAFDAAATAIARGVFEVGDKIVPSIHHLSVHLLWEMTLMER